MEIEPSRLMEELHAAQQNLSEVIDECVFVERQRDLTEQRLTAVMRECDRLVADTFFSLMSLIEYLSLLERRVIIPAFGTFSTVVKKDPQVGATRSSALKQVEKTLNKHNSTHLQDILETMQPISGELEEEIRRAAIETPVTFSIEEAYVLLRALLDEKDKLMEKISDTTFRVDEALARAKPLRSTSVGRLDEVRELRQKVAALIQELQQRDEEKREASNRDEILQKALESEKASAEVLHRLRDTIERQRQTIDLLRSSNRSLTQVEFDSPVANSGRRSGGGNDSGNGNNGEDLILQIKANEMTIGALNKELAILGENYRVLEGRSAQEMEELRRELTSVKERHQEEQEECNAVLGRVTTELEQLVIENAQLKKRLREQRSKKVLQRRDI